MNVYICAGEKGGKYFMKLPNVKHERGKAVFSKPKLRVNPSEHTRE